MSPNKNKDDSEEGRHNYIHLIIFAIIEIESDIFCQSAHRRWPWVSV